MPYPPPTLPINRTNALQQADNHPADHNAANGAINDLSTHAQAQDVTLVSHQTSLDALYTRVQGNAVMVTTDANGGCGINLNSPITGGYSVTAMLSTQNAGLMNTILTLFAATGAGFSLVARRGDGVPVGNTALTIHWQTA